MYSVTCRGGVYVGINCQHRSFERNGQNLSQLHSSGCRKRQIFPAFFYGENFPADLTAAHVTLGTTSPPDLARNILLNLGAQTTQPTWCLTQIPEGYVFVMHSSAEPRTLLEWLPTSEGNALRAEALQQDRLVQTSSLFAVS